MTFKKACLAAALTLAGLGTAHADTTWSWSYTGVDVSAFGTFTTAGAALVPEDILSISGFRNGAAITGLVPLDTDPNFLYDNQFSAVGDHFTDGGMLFSVAGLDSNVNVYFFAGTYTDLTVGAAGAVETPITFAVSAVPEPATALALLTGLGVLGLRLRRRQQA
jgi:hypothetical protein